MVKSSKVASKASSAKKSHSRSTRAGLSFPVGRINRLLKKGKYASRIGGGAPVYLAAVLGNYIVFLMIKWREWRDWMERERRDTMERYNG